MTVCNFSASVFVVKCLTYICKTVHLPSDETAVEARQPHQIAQLTNATLTNMIKDMNDRSMNAQRDISFQCQELSLTRAIMELRSKIWSLKVNLLLENDEGKKQDMNMLLGSMKKAEDGTLKDEP